MDTLAIIERADERTKSSRQPGMARYTLNPSFHYNTARRWQNSAVSE
jgi:hypothetical protein